jgi:hypothetical protein
MDDVTDLHLVRALMEGFAERTGLSSDAPPARYLWTDAFAVCNLLELHRRTGADGYRELALRLVEQVHGVLGRHRDDDARSGWLSGLDDEERARRPTAGGLRIGKKENERGPDEPPDEEREWDRDGQYYHYLTKWMHALARVAHATREPLYVAWARELAKAVHPRFLGSAPGGRKRLHWKMSIDLSRPLVAAMGQHDPLDGLLTYCELQTAAAALGGAPTGPDLGDEMADMAELCRGENWVTDDPLGIGGLLFDAGRLAQLTTRGAQGLPKNLLGTLLDAAHSGLASWIRTDPLGAPVDRRLPFRELGLSIGWKALARWRDAMGKRGEALLWNAPWVERIEGSWAEEENRRVASWTEHLEINTIMLATSLAPEEYLSI